jgi:tetratricopeptide (TPR) repeat protein
MASFFEDPEFKSSLKRYEDMAQSHVPAYFDGEELTDIAEYYASIGDEEKADEAVKYGLSMHPDDIDLLIFKARSFTIHGDTEEARKVLSLITDQNDREVKFLLFEILDEEGRDEEADKVLDDLAADEEYSMEVMADIMQTYVDNDILEKAEEWYGRLEKAYDVPQLIRTNKRCRSIFCDYYLATHDSKRCIPILQELVDEAPYSGALWNDLARCYIDLGDEEKAQEAVDFALAINENDSDALILKAGCYRMSGNVASSIEYLKRAAATGKQFPYVDMQLAKTYLDIREYEKMMDVVLNVERRQDEFDNLAVVDEMNGDLAIGYMAIGQEQKGAEYLRKVLGLFANSLNTKIVTGHCALLYGDKEVAVNEFRAAIDIAKNIPQKPELYFQALFDTAGLLFDFKVLEEAGELYKELIKAYPEDCRMALYLAMYCFAYTRQLNWFYHCFARIRKELPEIYAHFGHMSDFKDQKFDELLSSVQKAIDNGDLDVDIYLEIPD